MSRYGEDGFDPIYAVKSDLPITKYGILDAQFQVYSQDLDEIAYWKKLLAQLVFPAEEKSTNEWITAVDIKGLVKRRGLTFTPQSINKIHSSLTFKDLHQTIENVFRLDRQSTNKEDALEASLIFHIHLYYHLRLQQTAHFSKEELLILVEQIHHNYEKAFAVPGEAVGGTAASACAAPTTQMALVYDFPY